MRTSFYFVFWAILYPLPDLAGNGSFIIQQKYFFIILGIIIIAKIFNSYFNDAQKYEKNTHDNIILEEIYNRELEAFHRRLIYETIIETCTGVYFLIAILILGKLVFQTGPQHLLSFMLMLIVLYFVLARSYNRVRMLRIFKTSPSCDTCANIVQRLYNLNYNSYTHIRSQKSYKQIQKLQPESFHTYRLTSIILASASGICGIGYIAVSIINFVTDRTICTPEYAGMYLFFGFLALHFCIRDLISIIHADKI